MIRVGLTGNIGSGKSVVAEIFSGLGIPVYNADNSAKALLMKDEVKDVLRKEFGEGIFDTKAEIRREALAVLVFSNKEKLNKLNRIVHPFVMKDYGSWLRLNEKHPYTIIEAAILFETGYDAIVDKVITVSCPEPMRISRIMKRDKVTEEQVRQRMNNQWKEEMKIEKSDFVIYNNMEQVLISQVLKIHKAILILISSSAS
jgi:dephospho-CoA kinase